MVHATDVAETLPGPQVNVGWPLPSPHRLHYIPRCKMIQVPLRRPQRRVSERGLDDRHRHPFPHRLIRWAEQSGCVVSSFGNEVAR